MLLVFLNSSSSHIKSKKIACTSPIKFFFRHFWLLYSWFKPQRNSRLFPCVSEFNFSVRFSLLFFWLRLLHIKYCIGHFTTSTCTFNESEELYDVRAEMGNNKIGLENGPTLCVWWIKMNIKKFISSKIFDFIAMECLCNWFCMFTKLISTSRAYEQQTKSLHTNISFMVLSVF